MKKILIACLFLFGVSFSVFSQNEMKTTYRPDGLIIDYFNPKPIARLQFYEVGTSIYKFKNEEQMTLNISVLFKNSLVEHQKGNLIIQTTNNVGLSLELIMEEVIQMNGRDVSIGLYLIDSRSLNELRRYPIKSVFIDMTKGKKSVTVTENSDVLIKQVPQF